MPQWNQATIVGVGLIGGSIGLAMRARGLAKTIVGVGRNKESLADALKVGAIDIAATDIAEGVKEAELVVVCAPVDKIVHLVQEVDRHCQPGTIVTDAGSTKGEIAAALSKGLQNARFVGGHPLAGGAKAGPKHADACLYVGRTVVLTPTAKTDQEAAAAVEDLWTSLGATVVLMKPKEHDEALAFTSHLPHWAAAAIAATTPEKWLPLTATGWYDTTRIAGGDAALWRQIFTSNRGHVLKALDKFEKVLAALREALETENDAKLEKLLNDGKNRRDAVGN
ncbi:prephenate dehydrogenase/arogenate dehydrogenase family protein [Blastopirellula sp. JC732]|uniref:Prephenate dehydrogenase/arogenate dehydrogenase family protein n=1 Tax=Blastopirellula sediminis TaxID=2894196 RepID=A0A9X1MKN6_9BACT|nr:prephenate dehydrogenase/arogenate dehydrogenase family protein [Blastopirellula sediminis]MCC9609542.1 prephenate dehydrogenase/arogenate dehydrogenase family protein [Blastopirellula sediminis]MCC9627682.1 prephenate dehydrogenase/arogenate dehydrogenase family protein [Blastopirellula sediminis]